ncbi:hypothetical protein KDD17_10330 [Sulfitobacter albidus]|uniref:Uncharacterized protein n=1 Tax=Sulfitobacter albidus TaxID=2829501 RepID=A0A975PL75_9RHOB|nr:hypothetical protein [Sulfitobacter albidus]QUJ75379.1 hypothetical protein KDD17_10330 [Sulfitobacter albidus]
MGIDADGHVSGDACGKGDTSKSGFAPKSRAKVCAAVVRGALSDSRAFPAGFCNTRWSLVDTNGGSASR